jgi:hypothetical protein
VRAPAIVLAALATAFALTSVAAAGPTPAKQRVAILASGVSDTASPALSFLVATRSPPSEGWFAWSPGGRDRRVRHVRDGREELRRPVLAPHEATACQSAELGEIAAPNSA